MAVTYCTAQDVATFCNLISADGERAVFGSNPTSPDENEVQEMIEVAEEVVEKRCGTAWGTRTKQLTDELHDIWRGYGECSIHLNYPNIVTFSSGTDKLEIWNGNSWIDYLTTYTEGRGADFFVDYKLGKIYFLKQKPYSGVGRLKATYRVNSNSTVPKPIKFITALHVGIMLANSEYASILFPAGESENNPAESRISRWEKQIEEIIKRYAVSIVPVNLAFRPI